MSGPIDDWIHPRPWHGAPPLGREALRTASRLMPDRRTPAPSSPAAGDFVRQRGGKLDAARQIAADILWLAARHLIEGSRANGGDLMPHRAFR